ncbi:MAG: glycosyltransferase family 1 protein [Bacteroidetes bacterium]|nr:MAG: glycosyltransferase family 1 protein [Bacteroidota bacterium]MBL1145618.1 glycosyltransferase family 1 protein [Bacteroidota bacterium]
MKMKLIYRKSNRSFHSIENVFNTLLPALAVDKFELPFESKGILNRIRNIYFLIEKRYKFIHITGHDHYLLWWPFNNTILTIHDIEALNRKSGIKKWIFKKLWFDWPIANATVITTISEFSKNEILRLGKTKTPIKVIPNPLTLPLSLDIKEFNATKPRILHIGTKENKNLIRLVEAIKELPVILVIVGKLNGQQGYIIEQSQVEVELLHSLSNAEMMEEYRKCDLLAFVSTYEGFGLPIIEAQAIGRAVITSNVASMPEVAGDGALLVNPYSVEEIKNGMVKLIQNEELRKELIKKGLENVKRFEPQKISQQYRDLYMKIQDD